MRQGDWLKMRLIPLSLRWGRLQLGHIRISVTRDFSTVGNQIQKGKDIVMKRQRMIEDKKTFVKQTADFFNYIFGPSLIYGDGEIEICAFRKKDSARGFFDSELTAAIEVYELCSRKYDVYFGVNPRTGKDGNAENIHWVSAFHASLDYGIVGHKDLPDYLTDEQAGDAMKDISLLPSIIVDSGGGFHFYWVLNAPLCIKGFGPSLIEKINKNIVYCLGGKAGNEITRLLRIPGTYNFKEPQMVRKVSLNYLGGKYYYKDIYEVFG